MVAVRLVRARVQKYRSIRDTGYFDVEDSKTILVGPNEAGKTALLQALQRLNAPEGVEGFNALRDYPRSEFNEIDSGKVKPSDVTVVEGRFSLDDADRAAVVAIDPAYADCQYTHGVRLDNSQWHRLEDAPSALCYGDVKSDLLRLAAHVDARIPPPAADAPDQPTPTPPAKPSEKLDEVFAGLADATVLTKEQVAKIKEWLDQVLWKNCRCRETT